MIFFFLLFSCTFMSMEIVFGGDGGGGNGVDGESERV